MHFDECGRHLSEIGRYFVLPRDCYRPPPGTIQRAQTSGALFLKDVPPTLGSRGNEDGSRTDLPGQWQWLSLENTDEPGDQLVKHWAGRLDRNPSRDETGLDLVLCDLADVPG